MSICSSLTVVTATAPNKYNSRSRRGGARQSLIDGREEPDTMAMTSGMKEASVVEYRSMRFVITERPSEKNMAAYAKELKRQNVTCVVRVGGTMYSTDKLNDSGIQVIDLPYEDGTAPTADIVNSWCRLLRDSRAEERGVCVAIHCVAGLGRAPVLVAIALIELGMKYEDAVEFIRQRRRGAINAKQLDFLAGYRPKSRLSVKNKPCRVM